MCKTTSHPLAAHGGPSNGGRKIRQTSIALPGIFISALAFYFPVWDVWPCLDLFELSSFACGIRGHTWTLSVQAGGASHRPGRCLSPNCSIVVRAASVRRLRVAGLASLVAGWVGCSRTFPYRDIRNSLS